MAQNRTIRLKTTRTKRMGSMLTFIYMLFMYILIRQGHHWRNTHWIHTNHWVFSFLVHESPRLWLASLYFEAALKPCGTVSHLSNRWVRISPAAYRTWFPYRGWLHGGCELAHNLSGSWHPIERGNSKNYDRSYYPWIRGMQLHLRQPELMQVYLTYWQVEIFECVLFLTLTG